MSSRWSLALTVGVSLVAHVAFFKGVGSFMQSAPKQKLVAIELAVVPPPPPPEVAPEPPKPPPKKRAPVVQPQLAAAPPPTPAPETPPTPSAPPVFGISMSSTGHGGSFSVAVGNTVMKSPEKKAEVASAPARYVAPAHAVTKMPERQGECTADYPAEAKAQGLVGQVVLDVEVRDDGKVGDVRVLRGLDRSLDSAAAQALRRCLFSPAEIHGERVSTRIRYTYTFVIES